MKVLGGTDNNRDPQHNALIAALIGAFAPACYTVSWTPWLRWVGAACVVVLLVIVLYLVTGHVVAPLPVLGADLM